MKFVFNIIIISCVVLFNTNIHSESGLITDDNIAEITERLENFTTVELIERRALLIKSLDEEGDDSITTSGTQYVATPETETSELTQKLMDNWVLVGVALVGLALLR